MAQTKIGHQCINRLFENIYSIIVSFRLWSEQIIFTLYIWCIQKKTWKFFITWSTGTYIHKDLIPLLHGSLLAIFLCFIIHNCDRRSFNSETRKQKHRINTIVNTTDCGECKVSYTISSGTLCDIVLLYTYIVAVRSIYLFFSFALSFFSIVFAYFSFHANGILEK